MVLYNILLLLEIWYNKQYCISWLSCQMGHNLVPQFQTEEMKKFAEKLSFIVGTEVRVRGGRMKKSWIPAVLEEVEGVMVKVHYTKRSPA